MCIKCSQQTFKHFCDRQRGAGLRCVNSWMESASSRRAKRSKMPSTTANEACQAAAEAVCKTTLDRQSCVGYNFLYASLSSVCVCVCAKATTTTSGSNALACVMLCLLLVRATSQVQHCNSDLRQDLLRN